MTCSATPGGAANQREQAQPRTPIPPPDSARRTLGSDWAACPWAGLEKQERKEFRTVATSRTILFLGPIGNSDQRAAEFFVRGLGDLALAVSSLDEMLTTVPAEGTFCVIPMEDNVRGEFTDVLRRVILEVELAIIMDTFVLSEMISGYGFPSEIAPRVALSHPDVLERNARTLKELEIEPRSTPTTEEACRIVKLQGNPEWIALAPEVVAVGRGLQRHRVFGSIESEFRTRYGLLSMSAVTNVEATHSLILVWPSEETVGTLAAVIRAFSDNDLDMTSLKSMKFSEVRPTAFLIEIRAPLIDAGLQIAIRSLVKAGAAIKLLGSYPSREAVTELSEIEPRGLIRDGVELGSLLDSFRLRGEDQS